MIHIPSFHLFGCKKEQKGAWKMIVEWNCKRKHCFFFSRKTLPTSMVASAYLVPSFRCDGDDSSSRKPHCDLDCYVPPTDENGDQLLHRYGLDIDGNLRLDDIPLYSYFQWIWALRTRWFPRSMSLSISSTCWTATGLSATSTARCAASSPSSPSAGPCSPSSPSPPTGTSRTSASPTWSIAYE